MSNIAVTTIADETSVMTNTTTDTKAMLNETYVKTANYSILGSTNAYFISVLVICAIGLVGNVMVLILMRDKKFSSLSYPVYLRFLAVSDTAVLIIFCISNIMGYIQILDLIGKNLVICRVWKFVKYTVITLSSYLMVGLTVDRFYCVVFPLKRDQWCTYKKAIMVCSLLTAMSVVLNIPLTIDVRIAEWANMVECHLNGQILVAYATFLRLVVRSTLPCLLILVFNIVIGIRIQRSARFRKTFSSTRSGHAENSLDKSLRPLMLVSILAFITIVPVSITECVISIMLSMESSLVKVLFFVDIWPLTSMLYYVNFGQNFYILMASSSNYRKIMMKQLKRKAISKSDSGAMTRISGSDGVDYGRGRPTTELDTKSSLYTSTETVFSPDGGLSTNTT